MITFACINLHKRKVLGIESALQIVCYIWFSCKIGVILRIYKCRVGRKRHMTCLKLHNCAIFKLIFSNLPLLAQKVNLGLHLSQCVPLFLNNFPFIFKLFSSFKKRFLNIMGFWVISCLKIFIFLLIIQSLIFFSFM